MRYVLLALLAVVLLITAALWSKLSVIVKYGADGFSLTFRLWRFRYTLRGRQKVKDDAPFEENGDVIEEEKKTKKKRRREKKQKKDDEKEKKSMSKKLKDGISLVKSVKRAAGRALGYLKHKIDISKIRVNCRFGTGDAAATGMICGAVWGTVGNIYIVGNKFFNLSFPSIDLTPVFETKKFELEFESIIRVRPAHIINAAILALFTYFMSDRKAVK